MYVVLGFKKEYLTLADKVEIIFNYAETGRSLDDVMTFYVERFPNRAAPTRASFYPGLKNFTEKGIAKMKRWATVAGANIAMVVYIYLLQDLRVILQVF